MAALRTLRTHPRFAVQAWRLGTTGKTPPAGQGYPIDLSDYAADPDAATQVAAMHCQHKDVLQVLVRDTVAGKSVLHVYAIRSKKDWRKCPDTGVTRQVELRYPDLLFLQDVEAFAPSEPWVWSPGADAVGAPAREIVL